MSKVIELIDSDEETANPQISDPVEPLPLVMESTDGLTANHQSNDQDSINNLLAQGTYVQQHRHHRRKSHQAVRKCNDMEFAVLPMEMEDDVNGMDNKNTNIEKDNRVRKPKCSKVPNILQNLPRQTTPEQIFNEKFDVFLQHSEMRAIIKEIAVHRLRINTLLDLNGMPEINFSLYTQPDRIRFQLEDRFKQSKMRQQSESSKLECN